MTVKQISVFLENKPGSLAALTDILSANDIDMRALSLGETADFGILRLIVDDSYKAAFVLKEAGFICTVTSVLALAISDKPGSFAGAVKVLGEAGINMEYAYAFTGRKQGQAYMVLRVADNEAAVQKLTAAGFTLCTQDTLADL